MHNRSALSSENPLRIKIADIQRPPDFAGTVVQDPRPAQPIAAVGDIKLVPVASGAARIDLRSLVRKIAPPKLALDELGDRAVLHERRQQLHVLAQ